MRLKQDLSFPHESAQAKLFGRIIWTVRPSWLSSIWEPTAVAGKEQAAGYQLHNLRFDGEKKKNKTKTPTQKSLRVENSPDPVTWHAVSPIAVSKHVRKQLCLQYTKADQGGDEDLLHALLTVKSCDVLP